MRRLRRLPYAIVLRLPLRVKLAIDHIVAKHFLVGLVGVVMNKEGRVLVLKHTYRPRVPYGLPTGWLKRRESPPEAMAREIREESGFDTQFVRTLHTGAAEGPRRLDVWLLYQFAGGDFHESGEVSEALWVTPESAPPLSTEQRRFIEREWKSLTDET